MFVVIINLLVFPQACGGALNLPLKNYKVIIFNPSNCMNIEIKN
jgi:hypothetical protein